MWTSTVTRLEEVLPAAEAARLGTLPPSDFAQRERCVFAVTMLEGMLPFERAKVFAAESSSV